MKPWNETLFSLDEPGNELLLKILEIEFSFALLLRRYCLYSGFLATVDNGKVSGNGRISLKTSIFWRWKCTKLFHCPHLSNVISILPHHVTSYVLFPIKCIHSCKINLAWMNVTMSRGACRELHFRLSCNHNVRLYSVLPDSSFWSCFR